MDITSWPTIRGRIDTKFTSTKMTLQAILFIAVGLLFTTSLILKAQERDEGTTDDDRDSTNNVVDWTPTIDVRTAFFLGTPGGPDLHADEPEATRNLLLENKTRVLNWFLDSHTILDNPQYHGAAYIDIDALFKPIPGISILAGLTMENRGISYGLRDTRNNIVLPRYQLGIDTTLKFGDESLNVKIYAGDFRDTTIDEGLFFANADIQGAMVRFEWNNLAYRHWKVGDAFAGLGLNINDADFQAITLSDFNLPFDSRGTLGLNWFVFTDIDSRGEIYQLESPRQQLLSEADLQNYGVGMSGRVDSIDNRGALYAQYGLRGGSGFLMNRSALLAGGSFAIDDTRFQLHGQGEYRYFGGLFNHGYRNVDVYYRDPEETEDWGNTVGPHLYPLSLFDRRFMQWPVMTEYQDLKDVTAWTLYAKGKWFFYGRFILYALLDLNYIVPEHEESFLYPFYEAGVGWEPVRNFSLLFSASNKGMNLDKHYPTFYLYERPIPTVAFRWNVK